MNQGSRTGKETAFMVSKRPEELCPGGDRAKNLAGALQKVVAKGGSAGIDNQSARAVYEHQEQTIRKLEQELRTGQYQPQAVKRVWIPKPGSQEKRPLGVPTVRDRIVQG